MERSSAQTLGRIIQYNLNSPNQRKKTVQTHGENENKLGFSKTYHKSNQISARKQKRNNFYRSMDRIDDESANNNWRNEKNNET